jgi:predicted PurR-regulated permease PerM
VNGRENEVKERNWHAQAWSLSLKIILLILAIFAVIWFIQKIAWVIGIIIIATLIVYSISPLSSYLTRKGMPHSLSVMAVYGLLLLSVLLFFYFLIPTMLEELRALASYLSTDYRYLLPDLIHQFDELLAHDSLNQALEEAALNLPNMMQQAVLTITGITGNIFSMLTEVVIILFLVYYLLRDLRPIKRSIIQLFPSNWRKEATHVLEIIDLKVGAYLRGNILRCCLVGVLTGTVMAIIGMPFALMLGILAGVLNIIVYVGPYLAGIPAVFLALAPDTPHPFLIIIIYMIIQALDGFVFVPLLLGRAVDLRPFTVIVSLLIGGVLLGFIGILLAIPTAATLKVIIYHYYLKEDSQLKL